LLLRGLLLVPEEGSGPRGPWAEAYNQEFAMLAVDWVPYVHWRSRPFSGSFVTVGADGLRRVEAAARTPEGEAGRRRVWTFGGSTMWGFHCRDGHTIPDALGRALDASGVPVEVVNFGQIGYVSTQEAIALAVALRDRPAPDLALFLDGFNDAFAAFSEGAAGLPMNEVNRRREFNLTREPGPFLARALLSAAATTGTGRVLLSIRKRVAGDAPPAPPPPGLEARVLSVYRENLRLVDALASAHGFQALFLWQPVLFTKDRLSEDERRLLPPRAAFHAFYDRLEAARAAETTLLAHPRFFELSSLFDGEPGTVFVDSNHMIEDGYERVGRRIAEIALPLLRSRDAGSR
jgi:lysophospholipase L1-like esterase